MAEKEKVLFVCLGNICRSPLAEAIFDQKIKSKGLEDVFESDSCGTSAYHIGDPPDPRTIEIAEKHHIPIESHGRQFKYKDFNDFDYILAMDHSNLSNILKLDHADNFSDKVKLMRHFDPMDKGADVPDPYFGGQDGFQEVYDILDRSIDEWLKNHQ